MSDHPTGRGSAGRFILIMPMAAIVTAALFLIMGGLIETDAEFSPVTSTAPPVITPQKRPTPEPPNIIETTFEEITPPPSAPNETWETTGPEKGLGVPTPGKGKTVVDPSGIGQIYPGADIPAYPNYPERCRSRGLEGYATVEYDVTARGEVLNARVVDSSNSCFDREAVRAIQNSKFSPGRARRGERKTYRFDLQE